MTWDSVIERNAASELSAARLVTQLRACEAASLAFCRLLERWGRGDAVPATPGARQAALRRAADRVETAIAGLEACGRPRTRRWVGRRASPGSSIATRWIRMESHQAGAGAAASVARRSAW